MEWIKIKSDDDLPELKDDSVLAYWAENGNIETVHIKDYFEPITAGFDENGQQLYARWYESQGVTHWMSLPDPPKHR